MIRKTLVIIAMLLAAETAWAARTISYQGYLLDAQGAELGRPVELEVRLYDSLIAGIDKGVTDDHVIYAEAHAAVDVEGGVFRISIGAGQPLDAKWTGLPAEELLVADSVYLEMWVDGERLSPRQRMGAMPAVFHAEYAKYAEEVENLPAVTEANLPNYPAEMIKSGTLSSTCIPSGLGVSLIDGAIDSSFVPSISAERFDHTGKLPPQVVGAMDASKITTGTISRGMLPNESYVAREDFIVMTGSVADEQMLVFPPGFDAATECQYVLTPGVTMGSVEGIDQIYLSVTGGVVKCQIDKHEGDDGGATLTVPCNANYMIVCMDGDDCQSDDECWTTQSCVDGHCAEESP